MLPYLANGTLLMWLRILDEETISYCSGGSDVSTVILKKDSGEVRGRGDMRKKAKIGPKHF